MGTPTWGPCLERRYLQGRVLGTGFRGSSIEVMG